MKVLVVEDLRDQEDVVRNALLFNEPRLIQALRDRGIEITPPDPRRDIITATNKEAASKEIRDTRTPFDLVILDLLIPERPDMEVDTQIGPLLGYEIVSEIRSRFGTNTAIVVYSQYVGSSQNQEIARTGLFKFTDMLRERQIAPPNEILWKERYSDSASLMLKLVRYAIDLTPADVERLTQEGILVPAQGATRQVLRDLKRMACSASIGFPRPDVLLLGENGVGKTTFARAYHLLRPRRPDCPQLGFQHLDLGSIDFAGSAPNIALFGATDFNGAWSLGAFVRSTLYKRDEEFVTFAGQEVKAGAAKLYSPLDRSNYPESTDKVDFDGSGTLFLDEVVNIGLETQAMLLQALSYDLHARHVYTTGQDPRRLAVGPSLVFATAQWNPAETAKTLNDVNNPRHFRGMKDYLFRIDQMRVTIPPLRDRTAEEIVQLLTALVKKRRPPHLPTVDLTIDPIVEKLLTGTLLFINNVADLQRIADQVMPEEKTITWQHVGPIFERERPLAIDVRNSPASKLHHRSPDYLRAREIYDGYSNSGIVMPLSRLARERGISQTEAYNAALIFMDVCGCATSNRWPSDKETTKVFGHNAKAFQTYMHRLSTYRNTKFGLASALRDLAVLKGFPVEDGPDSGGREG